MCVSMCACVCVCVPVCVLLVADESVWPVLLNAVLLCSCHFISEVVFILGKHSFPKKDSTVVALVQFARLAKPHLKGTVCIFKPSQRHLKTYK